MAEAGRDEGTVTILFTDVEGATDLGTRTGDELARRVLRSHEQLVRDQVAQHGGREVKSLGDGFMIAFGSARRAVACAVAIQRALERKRRTGADAVPAVRMGLNSGEAIHEEGDLFGSAVSAASRISAKARGGQILVSEVVKFLAGNDPEITFSDLGRFKLKGFEDRWRLFEVEWREKGTSGDFSDRTPFVGREEERAELHGHLDRLTEGRGALIAIGGEPGVGKTRLAEEILAEARRRGYRTLTGRCYEMDSPPPYLPFVEILEQASREVDPATFRAALGDSAGEVAKVMPQLRNIFDDLPPPLELPPEQERRYLFNSIQEFVQRAAAVTPLVVLLDDVHWTDESSALLMQHIAGSVQESPLFIIATYRDIELDTARPLARTLDSLIRSRAGKRMSLRRLSAEGTSAMLTKLAGSAPPPVIAEAIFNETDGNAFFVEEVFRHLSEEGRLLDGNDKWRTDLTIDELEVPEGVRLVIGRRIERLAEDTQKVLTSAAVIGRRFSFDLLEMSSDATSETLLDAIDEATAGHLLEPIEEGTSFTFVHELIRQTLLGRISMPRRQRAHLKVAEAMAKLYQGRESERAAEVAHHFYQAGAAADPLQTRRFLILAGDNALEAAAFEDALHFYEEALALEQDEDAAELYRKLGSALRSLGKMEPALEMWNKAMTLHEASGDRKELAAVAAESALQLAWAGRWGEVLEVCGRVLGRPEQDRTLEHARLSGIAGMALGWAGQHDTGANMIDGALKLATELGDKHHIGEALAAMSIHNYAYSRFRSSIQAGNAAVEHLRETGDLWSLTSLLGFITFAHECLLEKDEAKVVCEELDGLAHKLGHPGGILFATRGSAIIRMIEGAHVDENIGLAQKDLEICNKYELPWTGQSHGLIGWHLARAGRFDEALEHLKIGTETDLPSVLEGFPLAMYFWVASQVDRALMKELEDRIIEKLPVSGQPVTIGNWLSLLFVGETYALIGDVERCRSLYALLVSLIDDEAVVGLNGRPIHAVVGLVAKAAGEMESAKEHLEEAMRIVEPFPDWSQYWDVRQFYAELLVESGEDPQGSRARELMNGAVEYYERVGLMPAAEKASAFVDSLPAATS